MKRRHVQPLLLVTLVLFFGLHIFRVFLPMLIWYGGQRMSAVQMALCALGTFALALLAPLVRRVLKENDALTLTAGGLILVRVAVQLVIPPLSDLVLAIVGLVLWSWFIPIWHTSPRNRVPELPVPLLAVALPLALLLDTGIRSALVAYDLAWQQEMWATMSVLILAGVTLVLLRREMEPGTRDAAPATEPPLRYILPLLGLGPWLTLALSISHNPAALTAAAGWPDLLAHLAVNAAAAAGAALCVLTAGSWGRLRRAWAALAAALLIVTLVLFQFGIGPTWLWFLLASLAASAALGWVLAGTAREPAPQPGMRRTAVAVFLGLLLLLVVAFLLAQYDLFWMLSAAGGVLAATALWAAWPRHAAGHAPLRPTVLAVGGIALTWFLVVAAATLLRWPSPAVGKPPSVGPLRVMTYNIHHGLDADFHVDLLDIADVIAAESPDVVVLNEVSRSRVTNGFVDMLPLISRRLGMPYVFGANYADGQYGNALLSRYPILEWDNTHFVHNTTETRGVLRVVVDAPGGPITFYATHLDHIEGPDNVRAEQVVEVLDVWGGTARAVLLGDLNARPDQPELAPIYAAGFVDALAAGGQEDVFTFWDPVPYQRIDYIFATPDLSIGRVWVVQTHASDHLPVLAEIGP
ncbi:MAG: endonuclease/exonuclease/phosphatase family protein [Anaerolineae bacterium]|nr:endonuclease/exonuclease/phosphatase family protein [Anaerolineae bacterium]